MYSFNKITDHANNHPEGPNIGFNSDQSWMRNESQGPAKIDLLHQGHTKGGTYIFSLTHPYLSILFL